MRLVRLQYPKSLVIHFTFENIIRGLTNSKISNFYLIFLCYIINMFTYSFNIHIGMVKVLDLDK